MMKKQIAKAIRKVLEDWEGLSEKQCGKGGLSESQERLRGWLRELESDNDIS